MRLKIAYLPGDGIGPEVGAGAVAVLETVAERFGHDLTLAELPFGGGAIDAHGVPLPEVTAKGIAAADAVLLGAIGGPKWDALPLERRPEKGLLALRAELGVWANLRAIKPHPAAAKHAPIKADRLEGVDILVVRELTGGVYFGEKRRDGDTATDVCTYSKDEIARVVRRAAAFARARSGRLTSVDKANVLETSRLWRETANEIVAAEFPDVTLDHVLVDAAAMALISNPRRFDVIVTENLFGDILTDEAAVLAGSIGLVPSASLGDGTKGLYEPIHGSAPDIAGQGKANPLGMIASAAMMLRFSFGLEAEADAVERAIGHALDQGTVTADLGGDAATQQVAEAVSAALEGYDLPIDREAPVG